MPFKNHVLCPNCVGGGFFGGDTIEEMEPCEYCNGIGSLPKDEADKIKQCSYCDEIVDKISQSPILMDSLHGSVMCEGCWDMTREDYKGTYGEDIGKFEPKE